MKNKTLIASNQRVDGPDIKNLINFNDEEFNILSKQIISTNGSVVVKGFDLNVSSGLLIEAIQEDLVCITPVGELAFYSQTDDQLNIAMANNATNYVEVQVFKENVEQQVKAFWDPNAGTNGEEFTQTVPTVTTTSMRLVVNQVGFSGDTDKVPVAVVVTNSGVVERIHDNYKNQVLSGSPTNPLFAENLLFRLNDVNNDGFQSNYSFGLPRTDTTINNLEDSLAGIMTQIKDILGDGRTTAEISRNNWFDERPANLFGLNQDRNIIISQGGVFNFNQGTNQVSFDEDIKISIPGISGENIIQTSTESPITIMNDQAAYVSLNRDTTVTSNLTTTVVGIDSLPSDKDIIVIARRIDDVVYIQDGTTLVDGVNIRLGRGVSTPGITTDTAIALWNGIDGDGLLNSGITVNASNAITGITDLTIQDLSLEPELLINADATDAVFRMQVNNTSTDSWNFRLDNSDSDRLKVQFDEVTNVIFDNHVDGPGTGGVSPIFIVPRVQGTTITPEINTLSPDTLIKAWGVVNSGGILLSGFNISSTTKMGTGFYQVFMRRHMANSSYAVVITPDGLTFGSSGGHMASVSFKNTNNFYVNIDDDAGASDDFNFSFIVIGIQ